MSPAGYGPAKNSVMAEQAATGGNDIYAMDTTAKQAASIMKNPAAAEKKRIGKKCKTTRKGGKNGQKDV